MRPVVYVNGRERRRYSDVLSGTINGVLTLYRHPLEPMEAATKLYVDTVLRSRGADKYSRGYFKAINMPAMTGGNVQSSTGSSILRLNSRVGLGGTFHGVTVDKTGLCVQGRALRAEDLPDLNWSKVNTVSLGKSALDYGISNALLKTGGTILKNIKLHADPINGLHLATKQYVDRVIGTIKITHDDEKMVMKMGYAFIDVPGRKFKNAITGGTYIDMDGYRFGTDKYMGYCTGQINTIYFAYKITDVDYKFVKKYHRALDPRIDFSKEAFKYFKNPNIMYHSVDDRIEYCKYENVSFEYYHTYKSISYFIESGTGEKIQIRRPQFSIGLGKPWMDMTTNDLYRKVTYMEGEYKSSAKNNVFFHERRPRLSYVEMYGTGINFFPDKNKSQSEQNNTSLVGGERYLHVGNFIIDISTLAVVFSVTLNRDKGILSINNRWHSGWYNSNYYDKIYRRITKDLDNSHINYQPNTLFEDADGYPVWGKHKIEHLRYFKNPYINSLLLPPMFRLNSETPSDSDPVTYKYLPTNVFNATAGTGSIVVGNGVVSIKSVNYTFVFGRFMLPINVKPQNSVSAKSASSFKGIGGEVYVLYDLNFNLRHALNEPVSIAFEDHKLRWARLTPIPGIYEPYPTYNKVITEDITFTPNVLLNPNPVHSIRSCAGQLATARENDSIDDHADSKYMVLVLLLASYGNKSAVLYLGKLSNIGPLINGSNPVRYDDSDLRWEKHIINTDNKYVLSDVTLFVKTHSNSDKLYLFNVGVPKSLPYNKDNTRRTVLSIDLTYAAQTSLTLREVTPNPYGEDSKFLSILEDYSPSQIGQGTASDRYGINNIYYTKMIGYGGRDRFPLTDSSNNPEPDFAKRYNNTVYSIVANTTEYTAGIRSSSGWVSRPEFKLDEIYIPTDSANPITVTTYGQKADGNFNVYTNINPDIKPYYEYNDEGLRFGLARPDKLNLHVYDMAVSPPTGEWSIEFLICSRTVIDKFLNVDFTDYKYTDWYYYFINLKNMLPGSGTYLGFVPKYFPLGLESEIKVNSMYFNRQNRVSKNMFLYKNYLVYVELERINNDVDDDNNRISLRFELINQHVRNVTNPDKNKLLIGSYKMSDSDIFTVKLDELRPIRYLSNITILNINRYLHVCVQDANGSFIAICALYNIVDDEGIRTSIIDPTKDIKIKVLKTASLDKIGPCNYDNTFQFNKDIYFLNNALEIHYLRNHNVLLDSLNDEIIYTTGPYNRMLDVGRDDFYTYISIQCNFIRNKFQKGTSFIIPRIKFVTNRHLVLEVYVHEERATYFYLIYLKSKIDRPPLNGNTQFPTAISYEPELLGKHTEYIPRYAIEAMYANESTDFKYFAAPLPVPHTNKIFTYKERVIDLKESNFNSVMNIIFTEYMVPVKDFDNFMTSVRNIIQYNIAPSESAVTLNKKMYVFARASYNKYSNFICIGFRLESPVYLKHTIDRDLTDEKNRDYEYKYVVNSDCVLGTGLYHARLDADYNNESIVIPLTKVDEGFAYERTIDTDKLVPRTSKAGAIYIKTNDRKLEILDNGWYDKK